MQHRNALQQSVLKKQRDSQQASNMVDLDMQMARFITLWENFTPETTTPQVIADFYGQKAHFQDPVDNVKGVDNIYKVFYGYFDKADHIVFKDIEYVASNEKRLAFMSWTMMFEYKKSHRAIVIEGSSRIRFDKNDGKIIDHVDYWDKSFKYTQTHNPTMA
jgi:hypothetical protein